MNNKNIMKIVITINLKHLFDNISLFIFLFKINVLHSFIV